MQRNQIKTSLKETHWATVYDILNKKLNKINFRTLNAIQIYYGSKVNFLYNFLNFIRLDGISLSCMELLAWCSSRPLFQRLSTSCKLTRSTGISLARISNFMNRKQPNFISIVKPVSMGVLASLSFRFPISKWFDLTFWSSHIVYFLQFGFHTLWKNGNVDKMRWKLLGICTTSKNKLKKGLNIMEISLSIKFQKKLSRRTF